MVSDDPPVPCYLPVFSSKNGYPLPPTKEQIRDHSYITSSHFWDFWTPLSPYVSMFLVCTKNKQKLAFSDLPPTPTSAEVIYEWSLRNNITNNNTDNICPQSTGESCMEVKRFFSL